jgi:uncharacterized protein YndB with AHSA1/START domain
VTAEIREDVIIATEHIKAPPHVVFPYFTDPTLIVTWIGERADLDARPGGVFSLDFGESLAQGAYVSVDPPYRVVFSWGIPDSDTLPPGSSIVEVVLTPDGDDTMVVLTHRGVPSDHLEGHRGGWEQMLGHLPGAVQAAGEA